MHVLAKAFSEAGYAAYALDMRGHGASGTKGKIAYVGQLEDDLESFVKAVPLARPSTLVGFLPAVDLCSGSPAARDRTTSKATFCFRRI